MIIKMMKQDCILCHGTGRVTPYLYNKHNNIHKKCNHKYNDDIIKSRIMTINEKIDKLGIELIKYKTALKTSVEVNNANNNNG